MAHYIGTGYNKNTVKRDIHNNYQGFSYKKAQIFNFLTVITGSNNEAPGRGEEIERPSPLKRLIDFAGKFSQGTPNYYPFAEGIFKG